MPIRYLSTFVTLAEEAHFGRPADICNVAQPTWSAAIRKLEAVLKHMDMSAGWEGGLESLTWKAS